MYDVVQVEAGYRPTRSRHPVAYPRGAPSICRLPGAEYSPAAAFHAGSRKPSIARSVGMTLASHVALPEAPA